MPVRASLAAVAVVVVTMFVVSCSQSSSPTSPGAATSASALSLDAHAAVAHSVTGSGSASEDGVTFRTSVAAHSDEAGSAWGEAAVLLDLRNFGLGKTTFVGKVNCLDVDGNSAWIGAVITHSTNSDIVPSGVNTITLVRDLGGNGQDIMHAEVFSPSVACSDRPALSETLISHGNYKVR